jgi:hypothetical protein
MVIQPIPSNSLMVHPLPDQTPTKMMERMLEFSSPFTWTVGVPATVGAVPALVIDPIGYLLGTPVINDIVQWYKYFRADVEVHFRVNTNQFYAGALAVTAAPGSPPSCVGTADSTMQARSWLGMKILSAQKQDTVVITLPWCFPQRFLALSDIQANPIRIWTVFVDILSPLIATITAPSNIDVTIFMRFKNAQLLFPYEVSSATKTRVQKQSGHSNMQIKVPGYKPNRRVVHVSTSTKDPVQEAASPSRPSPLSTVGTLLSQIPEVGGAIEGAMTSLQPILDVGTSLLGLLDKPEIQDPVTRVYPTMSINSSQADRPDPSLPLTLYQTSYLNIDPSTMPGGETWTMARLAATPTLHAQYTFTPSAQTVSIPFIATGTPLDLAINTHALWRTSVRYMVKFFAPSFVSGRILFLLSPGNTASIDQVANNLTRVVDVKGDTTDTFTVPFICPTDFYPSPNYIPSAPPLLTLQISVLTQIVTNDISVTPSIDMVIFSAAGPDFQVSGPLGGYKMDYSYPNTSASIAARKRSRRIQKAEQLMKREVPDFEIVKQCDVFQEFKMTFNPFLMDCEYLTDSHHSTSETTLYVTDILKRYCTSAPLAVTGGNNAVLSSTFSPNTDSVQYLLLRSFLFTRGGVRYRLLNSGPDGSAETFIAWGVTNNSWSGSFDGCAGIMAAPFGASTDISITIPWIQQIPYMSSVISLYAPTLDAQWYTPTIPTDSYAVLTAVRDDFQLGFLVAPDVYT